MRLFSHIGPYMQNEETNNTYQQTPTHLCLARDWGHFADVVGLECVDDGALPDVRIADKPDADLLLVRVQLQEKKRLDKEIGRRI